MYYVVVGDAKTQLKELEKVGLGKPILVKDSYLTLNPFRMREGLLLDQGCYLNLHFHAERLQRLQDCTTARLQDRMTMLSPDGGMVDTQDLKSCDQ